MNQAITEQLHYLQQVPEWGVPWYALNEQEEYHFSAVFELLGQASEPAQQHIYPYLLRATPLALLGQLPERLEQTAQMLRLAHEDLPVSVQFCGVVAKTVTGEAAVMIAEWDAVQEATLH